MNYCKEEVKEKKDMKRSGRLIATLRKQLRSKMLFSAAWDD